jgi:hypothetical protein
VENVPTPMMARQALQVSASIDGLRLAPQPGASIRGRLRVEGRSGGPRIDPSQIVLVLHPADRNDEFIGGFWPGDGFNTLTQVGIDGSFEWKSVPPGNYFVQLAEDRGGGQDMYLKSTLANGRDGDSGISVNGGTIVLDLVASSNGGVVEGLVADQSGKPFVNAVILAVPDARFRGRDDRFCKTVSDQSGRFVLTAIPPGDYTLFAWESVDGEAYYNPDFLKTFDGQGSALRIAENEHKSVPLTIILDSGDEQ